MNNVTELSRGVSAQEIAKYGRDCSGECGNCNVPKGEILVGAGVADGRSVVFVAPSWLRVWMS